ncbi:MAG: YbaN family protein [Rhizobiales bacterium]|nr:YbaN family protein [Hyphomicrobiales bacterium]
MSRPLKYLMIAAGWVCVAIGIVGVILPGIPGTVFLIIAAWLFARSSPRFEHWLVTHPKLGPQVVKWRATGAIAPRIKAVAIGSMALSWAIVWLTAPPIAIAASGLCLAGSALYVGTRPNS